MNRDQLLDAIGTTGESMLKETEQLRLTAVTDNAASTRNGVATRRPARRKMMILLAACMILLLGTVAAYAAGWIGGRGGRAETGTNEEGEALFKYYPNEDMRVPITAITGDILNSTAQMKENWRILSAGNQLTPYSDPLPDSSSIPFIVSTSFNTATEAAAYIGYADMVLPQFAQNTSPVKGLAAPVLSTRCTVRLVYCASFQVSGSIIASWVFSMITQSSCGRFVTCLDL